MIIANEEEYLQLWVEKQELHELTRDQEYHDLAIINRLGTLALALHEYDYKHHQGRGDWGLSPSGKRVWFDDPRVEDIDIKDIAHALSKQCRFAGGVQSAGIYSVAQHCVLASHLVDPAIHALEALLHDGAEAYLQDIISPMKRRLGDPYRWREERWMEVIHQRYGITSTEESRQAVHAVDMRLCQTEARCLTARKWLNWDLAIKPFSFQIAVWTPEIARQGFLTRFAQLRS